MAVAAVQNWRPPNGSPPFNVSKTTPDNIGDPYGRGLNSGLEKLDVRCRVPVDRGMHGAHLVQARTDSTVRCRRPLYAVTLTGRP